MSDYILVTGGAGYIGSHTVIELINNGYKVVIVDNLSNSSYDSVARIEYIAKQEIPFFNVDIRNYAELSKVFEHYKISGVIHFAALKAVGESTQIPLKYYENNVNGTINLVNVMKDHNVKNIVFSSSATVYGDVTRFKDGSMIPIPEECPPGATNPYGNTKRVIEMILEDIHKAEKGEWTVAILRYFNPIGAHPSGLIGEDPLGIPNNLLPYLAQVAIGRREKLSVFGSDYDSHDGTPIRDYIHVVDLAKGHICALKYLNGVKQGEGLYREWNLGTGKGSTVFDVYNSFCKAVGRELPYEVVGRRAGDVLNLTANPTRANKELNWEAKLSIDDACKDLWRWTTENPFGFQVDNYKWNLFQKDEGYKTRLHTIKQGDLSVSLSNYGASIQDITFKGQSIVNKYDNGDDYKDSTNPLFGATVGRYANRISNGTFELNGKTHALSKSQGNHTLHGGFKGYDKKDFLGPIVMSRDNKTTVQFVLNDNDNSDGFLGSVYTYVTYTVSERDLEVEFKAQLHGSEESTIVNLTNHSYFNLTGGATIDGTIVTLSTNETLEMTDENIPTGKIVADPRVKPNQPLKLSSDISFDHCFVVDKDANAIDTRSKPLKQIVQATHPESAVELTVSTTEPAFQLYTGDFVNTKGHGSRSGFCVEPSRFVDAISNKDWAGQVTLHKNEVYGAVIKYSFK